MQKQLSRETLACKSTVITAPSFHCAIPRGIHHPLHLAHSPGSLSQAVGPTEVVQPLAEERQEALESQPAEEARWRSMASSWVLVQEVVLEPQWHVCWHTNTAKIVGVSTQPRSAKISQVTLIATSWTSSSSHGTSSSSSYICVCCFHAHNLLQAHWIIKFKREGPRRWLRQYILLPLLDAPATASLPLHIVHHRLLLWPPARIATHLKLQNSILKANVTFHFVHDDSRQAWLVLLHRCWNNGCLEGLLENVVSDIVVHGCWWLMHCWLLWRSVCGCDFYRLLIWLMVWFLDC